MRIHHLLVGTRRSGAALGLTAALAFTCAVAATPASASELTNRHLGRGSHTVDITGVDFSYRINAHGGVGAGLVELRFHNRGQEDHQAQLFRLDDGVTPDKFRADLASGNLGSIFADSVPAGGAAVLRARDSQTVLDPLQGGTYAVVCFVPDIDGVRTSPRAWSASSPSAGQWPLQRWSHSTPTMESRGSSPRTT
jgi:hypothetical protein